MEESHLRSLIKSISWRIFGTFSTSIISYLVTHEIKFAIYIGIFEFLSKIIIFYFHERIWLMISIGKHRYDMKKKIIQTENPGNGIN